jgi:dual specificity MAP kinase phosphatase
MALAERFKVAVEKKAGERRERMRVGGGGGVGGKGKGGKSPLSSVSASPGAGKEERTKTAVDEGPEEAGEGEEEGEGGEDLISYNVFILDATASEMEESLPHLIVRMQGAPNKASSASTSGSGGGGAHTQGTDGETCGETCGEDGEEQGEEKEKEKKKKKWKANTIDFALREKEEMRDLTKASEIISVLPSPAAAAAAAAGKTVGGQIDIDLSGSTTASYWDPTIGQVFLGNSNDVPLVPSPPPSPRLRARNDDRSSDMDIYAEDACPLPSSHTHTSHTTTSRTPAPASTSILEDDPFVYKHTNDPSTGFGYDICVECHEMAPFPSTAHLRAADEHLQMLDALWADRNGLGLGHPEGGGDASGSGSGGELPIRPPPNANAIVHLPFPSSPPSTAGAVASLLPFVKFLERVLMPVEPTPPPPPPPSSSSSSNNNPHPRRWSSVSSMIPSFPAPSSYQTIRSRSSTSPSSSFTPAPPPRIPKRTRPLKVLIYSSDGYTESSVPALCLLMAVRGLSLPEAYLELQVVKRRSFFVYQNDLGVLRRVEGRLMSEREQERARGGGRPGFGATGGSGAGAGKVGSGGGGSLGRQNGWARFSNPSGGDSLTGGGGYTRPSYHSGGRPAANSISVPMPTPTSATSQGHTHPSSSFGGVYPHSSGAADTTLSPPMMIVPSQNHMVKSRPRASTSPWLPSLFEDHQSWFSDPRFDGSFPSRVLPFLYLGNL